MEKIYRTKKVFITAILLAASSISLFAAENTSIADRGNNSSDNRDNGDRGSYNDQRHNNWNRDANGDWNGGGGYGGGYAAPYYPFYLPPQTPNQAFPDDAQENSMYRANQHQPEPH